MKNKSSVFCVIMGILGYVMGIAYALTLILIPIAIYCFIGAKMYMDASNLTESELTFKRRALIGYAVFFSIVAFPIGLISIAPAFFATSNNVVVSDPEGDNKEQTQTTLVKESEAAYERKETSQNTTSKEETLEKLNHLYDEGLITKAELERAKAEIEKQ